MAFIAKTFLLIALSFQAVHFISGCRSWRKIQGCLAKLNSYGGKDGGISYSFTEYQLNQVCSIFSDAQHCMDSIYYHDCSDLFLLQWQSLEGTFNYLCHEGYDDYLEHSYCLSSKLVNSSIHACSVEQEKRLDEWSANGSPTHEFCSIVDDSIACVAQAVWIHCHDDARAHMTLMMTEGFQPLRDYLDCPDTHTTTSAPPFGWTLPLTDSPFPLPATTAPSGWSFHHTKAWAIGVAVAVTILGLAVLGLIIFVACWLKKYRSNRAPTRVTETAIGSAGYPVVRQGYPQISFSSPGNASKDAMVHFDVNNPVFQNAGNHYRQQAGNDDMPSPPDPRDAWSPPPPYVQPLSVISGTPMIPAIAPADTTDNTDERPTLDERREAWSPPPPYIQTTE